MELIINHKSTFFEVSNLSLEALVMQHCQGKTSGLAVAVNQKVIPKKLWSQTILQNKDSILLITATQGG